MKLSLLAIGRMKKGPETELFDRYWARATAVGKTLGFQPLVCRESIESKATRPLERMAQEAESLAKNLDEKALLIALDERGQTMTSPDFAALLAHHRDRGHGEIVFLIGGADGLDAALRARATHLVSFGAMTWPHQLVRVLLAEQIYRAFSILSGHPYHKP